MLDLTSDELSDEQFNKCDTLAAKSLVAFRKAARAELMPAD
jgi:hypothetical protein